MVLVCSTIQGSCISLCFRNCNEDEADVCQISQLWFEATDYSLCALPARFHHHFQLMYVPPGTEWKCRVV